MPTPGPNDAPPRYLYCIAGCFTAFFACYFVVQNNLTTVRSTTQQLSQLLSPCTCCYM